MTWVLVAIVALAVWHYVWDGILTPSFRAQYRFELFALRDRAREWRYTGRMEDDLFQYVEEAINTAVNVAPSITVGALRESYRALEKDPEFNKLLDQRVANLKQTAESDELLSGIVSVVYRALIMNSGGWFVFLVPAIAIIIPIRACQRLIQHIVVLTESEVLSAIPTLRTI